VGIGSAFNSFTDAPGGFTEEFHEIDFSLGAEYWYKQQIAIRTGISYEDVSKGAGQYISMGAGTKFHKVELDLAAILDIPPENFQNNSITISLFLDLNRFKRNLKHP
jgi:hypothetical protein